MEPIPIPPRDHDTRHGAAAPAGGSACVVCGEALAAGAGKCKECGSFQGEPCVVCAQRLPPARDGEPAPRKCTECDSHQSKGRRAMAFSTGTLALLTALLAVGGLVLPPLHAFLVPASLSVLGTTEDGHLLVQVTNRTGADVYIGSAELSGSLLGGGPYALKPAGDEGGFVERDQAPIPSGSNTLRLRPTRGLVLTGTPDPDTRFTLELAVRPGRAWSPKTLTLVGMHDFVCTWDQPAVCSGRQAGAPATGAEP